jgi:Tfp pilus assembly protein PilF
MEYDQFVIDMLAQSEDLKLSGEFKRAIGLLQKVIIHEPDCFEAYEEIGDNYISIREMTKARKALNQSLKINDKSANGHYLLGFLYSLEQKWEASVEELEKADNFSPNHPEILRCLGWSFHNYNRKSQQGLAILERSNNLSPNDPNILCDLGVCYMNSNDSKRAEDIFNKVLKLNPNSSQAKECLSFLKIIKGGFSKNKKES